MIPNSDLTVSELNLLFVGRIGDQNFRQKHWQCTLLVDPLATYCGPSQ